MTNELSLREQGAITAVMTDRLQKTVEGILANTEAEVAEITPQQMAKAIIEIAGAVQDIAMKQHQIMEQLTIQNSRNVY